MDKNWFRGKRVLLTGHTGFKGTWMTVLLQELGAVVCGYSLPLSPISFYASVKPHIERHEEGDIADTTHVLQVIEQFRPEIIIHLASHSSLDGSDRIPDFILKTNIMGVVNLMEAVRKTDIVKAVLIVTSDKCYKNLETDVPYKEDSLLDAVDPYSTSKVCQELITKCYRESFFKNQACIATARASNVIGAGDYNITRLIPYLLDCFQNGQTAHIRNQQAIRPWQYVLDVLWGYLLLVQKLYEAYGTTSFYSKAYNFGPTEDGFAAVGKVVKELAQSFSGAQYEFGDVEITGKETTILKLDSHRARTELEWNSEYSLSRALNSTAAFVKETQEGKPVGDLCKCVIREYIKEVSEGVSEVN